jgi:hypothetical protein
MSQTVNFLRTFNRWRRGDETLEQPCPRVVGEMIDAACADIEQWRECATKLYAAVCYLEPALLYDDPEGGFTNEREAAREFMRLKKGNAQ